jgi:hypothetical protein
MSVGLWGHSWPKVLNRMQYWHRPLVTQPFSPQYLTFDIDCGGFNNIRMGFEFAVLLAFITRRTLVLPPPTPWYLIDFGPIKRMKRGTNERTTSSLDEYFNMSSLRAFVPLITSSQFIQLEAARLNIPLSTLRLPRRARAERRIAHRAKGAARGGVLHLEVGHNVTWRSAKQLCRSKQRRLCSYAEICPPTTTSGSRTGLRNRMVQREPWLWSEEGRLHGDHWAPFAVARSALVHDWVEVGDSAGRQCTKHSAMGLPPPWAASTAMLKGHVFCCAGSARAAAQPGKSADPSQLLGLQLQQAEGEPSVPSEAQLEVALASANGGRWWTGVKSSVGKDLPWSSLVRYIAWPDVDAVEADADNEVTLAAVDHRKGVEYTAELRLRPLLNLPSCKTHETKWRYLGQVANALVTPAGHHDRMDTSVRQVLRDGVRFVDVVWEVAARVVAKLGAFQYSALHIRRNDLQYKGSWSNASVTLRNVRALLLEGEPLYIATDEMNPDFFAPFLERHPQLYQWKDMFTERAGSVLKGVQIPRKLIGCIEQAICAMGRRFIGTEHSTFSGYINRIRGYVDAPDKLTYYHNVRCSSNPLSYGLTPAHPGAVLWRDMKAIDMRVWPHRAEHPSTNSNRPGRHCGVPIWRSTSGSRPSRRVNATWPTALSCGKRLHHVNGTHASLISEPEKRRASTIKFAHADSRRSERKVGVPFSCRYPLVQYSVCGLHVIC